MPRPRHSSAFSFTRSSPLNAVNPAGTISMFDRTSSRSWFMEQANLSLARTEPQWGSLRFGHFGDDEGAKDCRILLSRIRCGSLERLKGDHTGIRTREASTTKHLAERRNCIPSAQAFIQTDGTPSGFKAAVGIPRVAIPLSQDRNPGLR